MNKGLEALKELRVAANTYCSHHNLQCERNKELSNIIEKELTALEIIKKKRVDVDYLLIVSQYEDGLEIYNDNTENKNRKLTPDEFDLLKEVSENE